MSGNGGIVRLISFSLPEKVKDASVMIRSALEASTEEVAGMIMGVSNVLQVLKLTDTTLMQEHLLQPQSMLRIVVNAN